MGWSRQTGLLGLILANSLIALALLASCNRGGHRVLEVAYVSAPQAVLRDQLSTAFNKIGTVKNGERLEVLEREKRFSRVRTSGGLEGWIEQRYLVDQETYDGVLKLKQDNEHDAVQANGVLRNDTNLHLTPGRETEHLYQLTQGAKISLLKREPAEKQPTAGTTAAARTTSGSTRAGTRPLDRAGKVKGHVKADPAAPLGPALEDWWLVRDLEGRVGWVLSRMVDVDVPIDIAQYAEGQRFVAFFVLNEVQDGDKKVAQYLAVLTPPHDGLPSDFDQVRVFTWNVRKHRYETAYREHKLNGVLPVTVTSENFDKEGTLPVFVLHVKDDNGNLTDRKYKLNTPIVRRVLSPGEAEKKSPPQRRRHARKN